MLDRRVILVPVFVAAQGLLTWSSAMREVALPLPDPARFPVTAGDWQIVSRTAGAAEAVESLRRDRLLDLTYSCRAARGPANLFVAWYRSQLAGNAQPHSPRMCLPGSGWMPIRTGEARVDTADGPIRVNRWLVANGAQHAAVLYWYQKPRRVIAGEWSVKFWLAADAMRDHRTLLALVRAVVWPSVSADEAALRDASVFTGLVFPQLREWMPR
jgi:EpsI family protein